MLTADGIGRLARGLQHNTSLERLFLQNNDVQASIEEGPMASFVLNNKTLRLLHLGGPCARRKREADAVFERVDATWWHESDQGDAVLVHATQDRMADLEVLFFKAM